MNKIGLISILVSCIIIIAAAYSFVNNQDPDIEITTQIPLADDANATADSVNSLVDSLNDFSLDFYQQIKNDEQGNIFFSPYSIFTAFSMAYEGTAGNTANEMNNVLNILQNNPATLGSFGRIYNLLNQKQEGYTISTANSFWAHQNYKFLEEYLNLLQNFYMAEAHELDFAKNVESAETINNWVEEQTKEKIKDMIQPDMLSDLTKLVITNAIYFKGLWDLPFNPEDTYLTNFELISDETVSVDMMSNSLYDFNYTETDDLQILKLYYQNKELSMIFILPKQNNITLAENELDSENLLQWNNNFEQRKITIQLPKFQFETKYTLNDIMMQMGIVDAFSPGIADFSKMDGTKNLFISRALHQAYIDVNEEGAEAAAATAIIMELTAIPDQFLADHPFIFMIQHEETGAILFLGRVMNPSE
jgi:serpin B